MNEFISKVDSGDAVIGVIGLGYVGLPLAVEFAAAGFKVIGFEVAQSKIDAVNRGENYIKDVDDAQMSALAGSGRGEGFSLPPASSISNDSASRKRRLVGSKARRRTRQRRSSI